MAKRALGKGLSALIGDAVAPQTSPGSVSGPAMLGDREAVMMMVDQIAANPHQPRKVMDPEALEELAASIRSNGVIQPVLVRRIGDRFELVAGERRLRATKMAGLSEIPALVCTMEESESLKLALLENIQREDLNAIEEAEAYRAIMDHYGATHQELADMLGKNRSTVTNMLRLLGLEESLQEQVVAGVLTMGHARALLAVEDPQIRRDLAARIQKTGMAVRALEKEVQALQSPRKRRKKAAAAGFDPATAALQEFQRRLEHHLGSPALIKRRGKQGRIEIEFFSDEDLTRVLQTIGVDVQL
ncbi:MAG: ParB/RepB/Spo0J family partition protein [Gemmatimonadetes bacterium]|nr:ParB/RepB/Spo0J family partition protein [Gemmatimonadota bacterium]